MKGLYNKSTTFKSLENMGEFKYSGKKTLTNHRHMHEEITSRLN
jgi:hypothetical protein